MSSAAIIEWAQQLILAWGLTGIFLALLAEQLIPPLPAALVLTSIGIGFVDPQQPLTLLSAIAASTLGSISGACILYMLGRGLPAQRIVQRQQPDGRLAQLATKLAAMPALGLIGLRWVPSVRTTMSLVAGLVRLPLVRFLWTSGGGILLWNSVWIGCGGQLRALWS